ncbi:MAG: HAD family hydrolase, partial [Oscillospiraceae bacterium]|nr:HAD family hydrolase [Oscillospiraceae bacterium]
MKQKYKAVFFDFDYTLGDASECIVAGFFYAFEQMGLPRPEEGAVRATIGMTLENAYTLLTGDERPEERERFRQLYVEKANPLQVKGTKFFPGAVEILGWLKGQGVTVAIVSTKRRSVIEEIFAYRKLEDKLDFVVGGTDVANYKPAPDAALLALSKAGITAQEAL